MVKITIYAEGGGDTRLQQASCRKGFSEFFRKVDIKLSVIACGGRLTAYKDFCKALKTCKKDEYCLLLVDSEAPVTNISKWQHVLLREGDKWQKPDNATEEHLHFMVECMEAWFMVDKKTLADSYGKEFNHNALSKNTNIDSISKQDLYATLNNATCKTTKGGHSKCGHSFELLSRINANEVIKNSSYAENLCKILKEPEKHLPSN
ncbi:MAG: DUF4276 family protein [Methylococcales bacterium]|nr:DUF4276 family protein [Methylococcales bacterium]